MIYGSTSVEIYGFIHKFQEEEGFNQFNVFVDFLILKGTTLEGNEHFA